MDFSTDQYDWSAVSVKFDGEDIAGLLACKYKTEQEKEEIYGKGNKPISIQKGNKKYSGEVKLHKSELDKMIEKAPNKELEDVPYFDVVINFLSEGGNTCSRTLKNCQFTECEEDISQGDKFMKITLPVIALDVEKS